MGRRELAESDGFFSSQGFLVRSLNLSQLRPGFLHRRPSHRHWNHAGTPVATAHSYQLVASKTIHQTDLRLTLGHVTSSAELAKIDPDTGLQFNQGPSRLRFMTVAVRRNFRSASLLATFSKADARDLNTGEPTPEAPRTIFDLLGTIQKLPFRLQARGEFEYVGTKPLGTGCLPVLTAECTGTPVKEFRGALVRPFWNGRMDAGVNFLIATRLHRPDHREFLPLRHPGSSRRPHPLLRQPILTYKFGHSAP